MKLKNNIFNNSTIVQALAIIFKHNDFEDDKLKLICKFTEMIIPAEKLYHTTRDKFAFKYAKKDSDNKVIFNEKTNRPIIVNEVAFNSAMNTLGEEEIDQEFPDIAFSFNELPKELKNSLTIMELKNIFTIEGV